jgi:undecaprenyl-diphosphatase
MGLALLILSALAFWSIAEDIVSQEALIQFDGAVVLAIHANSSPILVQMMIIISLAGSQAPLVITTILALFFILRRRWQDLFLLIVTIVGGELLDYLLKFSVQRARPVFPNPFVTASGFSFPSGHAMESMVFYGLIAYLLMRDSKRSAEQILIFLIFVLVVLLVGFSRIYLGVHYPSDVLGGYFAGIAWLVVTINGSELLYRLQHRSSAPPKRPEDHTAATI